MTIPTDTSIKLAQLAEHFDPRAQRKLERLLAAKEEEGFTNEIDNTRRNSLTERRGDAKTRVAHLKREKEMYGNEWDDVGERELQKAIALVDKFDKDIKALDVSKAAKREKTPEQRQYLRFLRDLTEETDVTEYYGRWTMLAQTEFVEVEIPSSQPAWPKALTSCRKAQADVIGQHSAARRESLAIAEIDARIEADVDKHASAGTPDLSEAGRTVQGSIYKEPTQGHVKFPVGHQYSYHLSKATTAQLGTAFCCWLFRDQVVARLKAEARKKFGDGGLTVKQRAARLKELESEFMALQYQEEALVSAMEEAGLKVERRPVHPLARLQLRRIANAPRPEPKAPRVEAPPDDFPTQGAPLPKSHTRGWVVPGHAPPAVE